MLDQEAYELGLRSRLNVDLGPEVGAGKSSCPPRMRNARQCLDVTTETALLYFSTRRILERARRSQQENFAENFWREAADERKLVSAAFEIGDFLLQPCDLGVKFSVKSWSGSVHLV